MKLDDFLDAFNVIDRVEGFVSSIFHYDRREASKGLPVVGHLVEIGKSAAGAGSWTFRVRQETGWTGGDAERLLNHYAVPVWGRRVTGDHYILSVPTRQANWAEYLILRRGMILDGPLFNPDNQRYAQKYAPGDQPPAWADRRREPRNVVDRLGDLL
jgi:hypothetical protein